MIVFVDLIMLLNFLVDFLLILGTNQLSGYPWNLGNAALASAVGGAYAGMCVLPGFRFMGNLLWRLVILTLMAGIAFGWNRSAIRRYAIFIILSMALGGIAIGFGKKDIFALVICAALLWGLCRMGFPGENGNRQFVEAELSWNDRTVRLLALKDTGNMLRDPLTGEQVLVCGADVGEELLGLSRRQLSNPVDVVCDGIIPGLRLIPYHTVGKSSGMLPVLRLRQARIGGVAVKPLIAFAPEEIGKGEAYRMLTGGNVQ